MKRSIQHNWFFPYAAETVWEYLTNSELLSQWLMKNDFQPIPGHQFTFRTRPLEHMGFDGIAHCRILDIVPHQRLSYSWKGGPGPGKITLDSIVTWTLEAKDEGTQLHLEHSGFELVNEIMFDAMNTGWYKNVQKILELIKQHAHAAGRS